MGRTERRQDVIEFTDAALKLDPCSAHLTILDISVAYRVNVVLHITPRHRFTTTKIATSHPPNMAPTDSANLLTKRDYYCDGYGYCYSTWNSWGRWVALCVIIAAVILLAFLLSCRNNRRRRRQGLAPMYGTGWVGNKYQTGQQSAGHYANQPYNGGQPAPPYYAAAPVPQQETGTTFNSNQGYYGNNVELQQPTSSYQPARGGDPVYEAPLGPPPTKGDQIIR
ncbi:hypothetical protein G7Y89_g12543 [Cudoniella acicularis]|uniref:Chitin synthesis regulation, Congo red resistance, RCR protein n=1 Tax=Cudoniella acicularis TaxID=354080 RepID=A0A8H4R8X8_9HELO|nr:hypothetical protein G7Y89_g12543 [Cudoniella acicularis]